jgi:hypothetical protein
MDNIVDFYIDSVDNDKNGVSMEVMKCVDYFICLILVSFSKYQD